MNLPNQDARPNRSRFTLPNPVQKKKALFPPSVRISGGFGVRGRDIDGVGLYDSSKMESGLSACYFSGSALPVGEQWL
jgi:hypothetical protein